MFDKQTQIKLTELMQNNFTDLDIYRERPFVFKNDKLILIVKPVPFGEHDIFLQDMAAMILKYYEIFRNIDFLNAYDYKDKDAVKTLIEKVTIFSAGKSYKHFKKDASEFIGKWSYVSKAKKVIKYKHNKSLCRKFLSKTEPSEFIYILFLLFVFNFQIVKKKTIEFLRMFGIEKTDTSSTTTKKEVCQMPQFSERPYSKSILDLLEQQSKLS